MNSWWEDVSWCLVKKPDACTPVIPMWASHTKCPTLGTHKWAPAPHSISFWPIRKQGSLVELYRTLSLQQFQKQQHSEGVFDLRYFIRYFTCETPEGSEKLKDSQEAETASVQHQGLTTSLFFHKEMWTSITHSVHHHQTPSLQGCFWERTACWIPFILLIFLLNCFFSPDHKSLVADVSPSGPRQTHRPCYSEVLISLNLQNGAYAQ